jgi:hypothetical protein
VTHDSHDRCDGVDKYGPVRTYAVGELHCPKSTSGKVKGLSDADNDLVHTLLRGARWLNEGVEIPAAQVRPLGRALEVAAIRIGNRSKTIQCSRCGEPNKLP